MSVSYYITDAAIRAPHWELPCSLPRCLRHTTSWQPALNITPWNQTPGRVLRDLPSQTWRRVVFQSMEGSVDRSVTHRPHEIKRSNADKNKRMTIKPFAFQMVNENKRPRHAWMWGKSYENECIKTRSNEVWCDSHTLPRFLQRSVSTLRGGEKRRGKHFERFNSKQLSWHFDQLCFAVTLHNRCTTIKCQNAA